MPTGQSVLNPQGPVAHTEANLIYFSFALMAVVGIVVFTLFAIILVRYRVRKNRPPHADYRPEWEGNRKLEAIWTIVPIIIIGALLVPTVQDLYKLVQPPKTGDPVTIDVTSADWKWLFTYPGQGIETVNYVRIPTGVPIQFQLTSVAPMNTFWVPELGGMEFSMPGKVLRLWLQASKDGDYIGRSGNFSGRGFVHMVFHVDSVPMSQFNSWVQTVKKTDPKLTTAEYMRLLQPGWVSDLTYSAYPYAAIEPVIHDLKNGDMCT
jgi:cytochrome aa3-600 menaquinol oxidase subunit 2